MSEKSPPAILRVLIGLMLVGALACIAGGAWLMATDKGAPLALFIGGALLGALGSVFAGQLKKKS